MTGSPVVEEGAWAWQGGAVVAICSLTLCRVSWTFRALERLFGLPQGTEQAPISIDREAVMASYLL